MLFLLFIASSSPFLDLAKEIKIKIMVE
jgi:hypothetical protein